MDKAEVLRFLQWAISKAMGMQAAKFEVKPEYVEELFNEWMDSK